MLCFYGFFTGSATAQSILREEEEGTLERLFMTPVRTSTLLAGKILSSLLTLIIQVIVLLVTSHFVFGVQWGAALPATLAAIGLIALAGSFGVFIMSMVKSSNQAGVIYGGVMTLTGLFGTYAFFLPLPEAFKRYALIVPQGWAMQSWAIAMNAASVTGELLLSVGVSLVMAAVFFVIGTTLFRRRFAR